MNKKLLFVLFFLFLFSISILAEFQQGNWIISKARSLNSLNVEKNEILNNISASAGLWTNVYYNNGLKNNKFTYSTTTDTIQFSPFLLSAYSFAKKNTRLNWEFGGNFYYKYKNNLEIIIDGLFFEKISDTINTLSSLDAVFLEDRKRLTDRKGISNSHIDGIDFFEMQQNEAYLSFSSNIINLKSGRYTPRWGAGYNGSLLLSGNTPSLNVLYELNKTIGKTFAMSAFFASHPWSANFYPDSISPTISKYNNGERYMAGHRLEIMLWDRLFISFNELAELNGTREFLRYFNPLNMFYMVNNESQNDANLLASVEFRYIIKNKASVYAEILNDDITLWDEGNPTRLAYQIGGFIPSLGNGKNIDLRAEYTYVRSYTYTHYISSINWHMSSGDWVGYWTGPDSDHFFMYVDYLKANNLRFRTTLNYLRQGGKSGISSWNNTEETGENVPYIRGEYTSKLGLDLSLEYIPFTYVKTFAKFGLLSVKDSQGKVNKPYGQFVIKLLY